MSAEARQSLADFYRERTAHFTTALVAVTAKINRTSNLRIATAILALIFAYLGFSNPVLFYALIPLAAVFVGLVLVHTRLFDRKVHLENLVRINTAELESLSGNHTLLAAGTQFVDIHHPYTHDLDIFGEDSVFQAINRCNTRDGQRSMAMLLSHALPTGLAIEQHQQASRELTNKVDFRQDLAASGLEIAEQPGDRAQLLAWLKVPPMLYGRSFLAATLWVLPAVTIAALIAHITELLPRIVPIALVFTQWIIYGSYSKRVNLFHEYISRKKEILEKYGHMLAVIRREDFHAPLLKQIRAHAADAGSKVEKLTSLVSLLNARLNFLTSFFVNSLVMYDLQCIYRLEKWKEEHGNDLYVWLHAISDAEVLSSIANFAYNHPHFTFPSITDDLAMVADDMGHPLLSPDTCITNSVRMGSGPSVLVVTGANMAGKSTFLRAIGVNLVLALAGAPVYATRFQCPLIPLRSGMRTADSLKDHESYFYAELNRLKSIMDELRDEKPLFILLDEILKGTNSNDKQKGSIALVTQLLEHPCLAIIATHDLALGALAVQHPSQVGNYCFEASIDGDQLSFDYKLRPGLAQNMNATFLMKKMGIIKES